MHTTPLTPELLRGVADIEVTDRGILPHRLPAWAREQNTDQQLAMVEAQPSAVRVVFRTRSSVVELEALPTKRRYTGAPPQPDGVHELLVDGAPRGSGSIPGGNILLIDMATQAVTRQAGEPGTVRFDGLGDDDKECELWLPYNEQTELIALRTDAPVEPVAADGRRVWLHHGSSISHGSNAAAPTGIWPAVAARRAGVELINLGFGGAAMLDAFTARAIRDTPADLISVKMGINLVNGDVMRMRAFTPALNGFLDTIREGHPQTPLVLISPILCPIHEDTPGPTAPDLEALAGGTMRFKAAGDPAGVAQGQLTLSTIRAEIARVVEQRRARDPYLSYVDGRELHGAGDPELPDALHPGAASHRLMGERFAAKVLDS